MTETQPGSDPVVLLERSNAVAAAVIANVMPGQMHDPTPCEEWDVIAVIQHIVRGTESIATMLNTGTRERSTTVVAPDDAIGAFNTARNQIMAAVNNPGALDQMVEAPFGTMPAPAILTLRAIDNYSHSWDIAKATGQSTDLDPALGEELLAMSREMMGRLDRSTVTVFKPEQPAPDDATPADRLAAFLGRTV